MGKKAGGLTPKGYEVDVEITKEQALVVFSGVNLIHFVFDPKHDKEARDLAKALCSAQEIVVLE
jgi:hypothetical protein